MGHAIKAGGVYFSFVFALGFVLGVFRTLVLTQLTGELAAVALELPLMLIASWIACGWTMRRYDVSSALPMRAAMAISAFAFLIAAEMIISTGLAGRSIAEHIAHYRTPPALLGLCGQLAFALFPLVRQRDR